MIIISSTESDGCKDGADKVETHQVALPKILQRFVCT